jgi:hypothetical protein
MMPSTAEAAKAFNRRLRQAAASLTQAGGGHEHARFVCECGCEQTVVLTLREYDRQGGAWLEGHEST